MKDYDMNLQQLFNEKLKELQAKGVSQNAVATQIGVSSSLISQYKSGSYPGDMKEIEDKVRAWLERTNLKETSLSIPYVDIQATKAIFKSIQNCQRDKDFSVIVGNAGVSKTETCKRYIEQTKAGIYVKINQSTKGALLRVIANELNLDKRGNTITLYEKIVNYLRGRDWVILVDEADYLKENCLQLLRHISDDAEIGVCMIGLPRLEYKIFDQKEDYQQLIRRIGSFLNLCNDARYNLSDCSKIIKSVWSNISDDLIASFFKASKGSIGTLTKLMGKSSEIANENNRDFPSIEDLENAKKVVMRASSSLVRI